MPEKQRAAALWIEHLWQSRRGRVSYQVLQEYYVTVTRKLRPSLPIAEAQEDVRDLIEWHPVPLDISLIERAWDLEERASLSFWDALIVAAASTSGASMLLTEDLQAGAEIDGVLIVNPFQVSPGGDRIHER